MASFASGRFAMMRLDAPKMPSTANQMPLMSPMYLSVFRGVLPARFPVRPDRSARLRAALAAIDGESPSNAGARPDLHGEIEQRDGCHGRTRRCHGDRYASRS